MEHSTPVEQSRSRPRAPRRLKVALALLGVTAASLTIASGEASAAPARSRCTVSAPAANHHASAARNCGVQSYGVRW